MVTDSNALDCVCSVKASLVWHTIWEAHKKETNHLLDRRLHATNARILQGLSDAAWNRSEFQLDMEMFIRQIYIFSILLSLASIALWSHTTFLFFLSTTQCKCVQVVDLFRFGAATYMRLFARDNL